MGLRSVNVLVLGIVVLVMASACLSHAPSTPSQTSTSNPSKTSPTASPGSFIDIKPPEILDFNYTPTKVVWDKIYDIKVTFRVIDDESRIKRVVLKFVPVEYEYFITKYGMRPEDYQKVFPPEKERVYELKPVDGVFDELKEEFSVEIKNITGGREYRIIIIAEDEAGNTQKFEYKTPYIRQYENFGRQLYEKGIIVGASYMSSYQGFVFNRSLDDYPLLGRYIMPPVGDIDEIVLAKHVDWAGYAGINVFFVDAGAWEKWKIDGSEGKVMKNLMDKGIKCAFMWGAWLSDDRYFVKGTAKNAPDWSVDLSYPKNRGSFLKQLTQILNSSLVNHSNYLKIDDRPVIFIYDAAVFVNESDAWDTLKKNTGKNPYILADIIHGVDDPWTVDRNYYTIWKDLDKYDAISSWVGFIGNDAKNPKYIKNPNLWFCLMNEKWSKFAAEKKLQYVASISPGFKYHYENTGIPRNVEQFGKRVENSLKYTKFIRIDTWNDFDENTFVEPSLNEGFLYLRILKQVLEEYLENITSPKPRVLDFNWMPTKVVWDKVYDIKVSFKVSYQSNEISSVKLIFKPENYSYFITEYRMRREDYYKVFPNDSRVYELTPVDGVLDEPLEEFSTNITNITGGAEYWIIIQIQTKNGRTIEYKRKTPYLRQYENFGRQLYEKGIIVGATYYPLYPSLQSWDDWQKIVIHPLLGKCNNVDDKIAVSKIVDWFTGYGGNTLFFSWGIFSDSRTYKMHENIIKLLSYSFIKDQVFASVLYETPHRLDAAGIRPDKNGFYIIKENDSRLNLIKNDFEKIKEITDDDNFLRINGRPVIYLYESKALRGNVRYFIQIISTPFERERNKPFFVSDHALPLAYPPYSEWIEIAKLFDGWTMWAGGYLRDMNYTLSYYKQGVEGWKNEAIKYNKLFMPSVLPGFNDPNTFCIPYERDPSNFKKALGIALNNSYVPNSSKVFIRIDTLDEYREATALGPTIEEKYTFLEILENSLKKW